jgi:adenosine deaminase
MRDLSILPKAHLHLHLEGGMRPATLNELAGRYGIPVPTIRGFGSFVAFADMYVAACEVIRTPEDLARVVRERVEDDVAAGAWWSEPSLYTPHHRERLGSDEEILRIVLDAGKAAAAEYNTGFGVMLAADRTRDPAEAEAIARQAVEWGGEGVVSFGLANDEAAWPPGPFAAAYDIAYDGGLLCTPHAGELDGPDSVRVAIDSLHANRIQHGVRAIEDPELIKRIADEGICLDVCPSSNVLLSVVPTLEAHPLPLLLAAGVKVSLNADDPLLFGPDLLAEYEVARTGIHLDDAAIAGIAKTSLQCSGAPGDLVRQGEAAIDAWLAS